MRKRNIRTCVMTVVLVMAMAIHADAQVYLEEDPKPAVIENQVTQENEMMNRPDLGLRIMNTPINKSLAPRVFSGYRHLDRGLKYSQFPDPEVSTQVWRDSVCTSPLDSLIREDIIRMDSLLQAMGLVDAPRPVRDREDLPVAFGSVIPDWLKRSIDTYRFQEDFTYRMMLENPSLIEYAYWDLPVPPRLPEEDTSLRGYLKRLDLPEISGAGELKTNSNMPHINWLHTFNIGLQLSQAYVSGNWYQGGNSYLAFLGNFLWDVQLNNVYHPKLIFQSTLSYKLAINSTPDDQFHKYSVLSLIHISEPTRP